MNLLLFFLASFGLAFVLGHSKISLPFRQWFGGWTEATATPHVSSGEVIGQVTVHKPAVPWLGPWLVALLECPACLGFHFGWAMSVWGPSLGVPFSFWWVVAIMACATSAVNLLLAKCVGML